MQHYHPTCGMRKDEDGEFVRVIDLVRALQRLGLSESEIECLLGRTIPCTNEPEK